MKFLKMPRPLTRTRDRKATERALLLAAAKLFAHKGYENTRTLEIAGEAGVNEALILRYFGGKEGLLVSLMKDEEALDIIVSSQGDAVCSDLEALPRELGEGGFQEALVKYFRNAQDIVRVKCPFIKIASSRALVDSAMAKIVRDRLMDRQLLILGAGLKQLLDLNKNKMSPRDIESLAMIMASMNYMMNFLMRQVYQMDPKKIDRTLELLAQMLDDQMKKERCG